MSRLEEIRARLAAATPGPWAVEDDGDCFTVCAVGPNAWASLAEIYKVDEGAEADAALIAAAPADLAHLLAEVERLTDGYLVAALEGAK